MITALRSRLFGSPAKPFKQTLSDSDLVQMAALHLYYMLGPSQGTGEHQFECAHIVCVQAPIAHSRSCGVQCRVVSHRACGKLTHLVPLVHVKSIVRRDLTAEPTRRCTATDRHCTEISTLRARVLPSQVNQTASAQESLLTHY